MESNCECAFMCIESLYEREVLVTLDHNHFNNNYCDNDYCILIIIITIIINIL